MSIHNREEDGALPLTPRDRRVLAIADRISEVLVIACAAVFFGGLLRALLAHFAR